MTIPSSSGLLNYIGQIENGKNGKEKPTGREPAAVSLQAGAPNQLCLDRYQPSRRRREHLVNVLQLLAWGLERRGGSYSFPLACYFGKPYFMAKSIKVNQKKRGRPATGRDPVSAVRLPAALTVVVDEWAQNHEANRSEAIRRLVELGLTVRTKTRPAGRLRAAVVADLAAEAIDSLGPKVKTKAKQPPAARAARAKELAAKAIDKMIDPAAPPEERAQRRRRLTKGPLEFREARVDQPKAKNGRNK